MTQHLRLENTAWGLCGSCHPMPTIRQSVCYCEVQRLQKHYSILLYAIYLYDSSTRHAATVYRKKKFLEFTIRN
ncbi:hypothetical protein XELAEV_18002405mg [Xenopus laevis]|nr:hypothetical protein XELAEV_18002405mg [Xenopus laevis]